MLRSCRTTSDRFELIVKSRATVTGTREHMPRLSPPPGKRPVHGPLAGWVEEGNFIERPGARHGHVGTNQTRFCKVLGRFVAVFMARSCCNGVADNNTGYRPEIVQHNSGLATFAWLPRGRLAFTVLVVCSFLSQKCRQFLSDVAMKRR